MSTTEQERCRYPGGIVCMYSKKEVKCMPLLFLAAPAVGTALEMFVTGLVARVVLSEPAVRILAE